ncbi:SusC/RagA family TonB-linked outer membrane protein [Mucilaginibacter sp. SP1R1]|uniref:SusC/RagA family TonB-linked outer membrane protein n=1 Tax=Mucilaginibacter sp. SP1R1 TaxID=2723091 RepID=UPI00160ACE8E|nr:TonB-dependent receptor [Mucilaginibacter sp. SP1R1]MBB6149681.1 TonB-linked SusC/RagA family outer membrane protein [Mucilaginibacter sp. SP1R1]
MIRIYKQPLTVFSKEALPAELRSGISVKVRTFAGIFGLLLTVFTAAAQTGGDKHPVSGIVKDETNETAVGVSVRIKHSSAGVVTDVNGRYSINAANSDTLQFTYIGLQTTDRAVGSQRVINVTMKSKSSAISEVVVVGYTSKQVSQLSSSVSVISGDKLRDVTSNDVASLLQGKAPGVVVSSGSGDPTSSSSILIRGASSINASTSPLIVVDGNIGGTYNASDVESITVLKDAAATGLYGSRAANGVIIITTKMGKAGQTRIDVSSTVGVNTKTTGNFHLMNSQQLYDYQKTFETVVPSDLDHNTNWFDLAFRKGITQNHTLSASGGSEKTQYYISGNYYNEQGTLIDNSNRNYNFRTNVTTKLNDKLKLSVLLNTIYNQQTYPTDNLLYDAYLNLPYDPAYNADGTPTDGRTYPGWQGRDKENPLQALQYNFSNSRAITTNGDLNLDYSITKHLTFGTYNRITLLNDKYISYSDVRTKAGGANSGELYNQDDYSSTLLTSNRLKYDNSFGEHNLTLLAVGEGQSYHFDNALLNGKGLPPGRPVMSTASDIISNPSGGTDDYNFRKYLGQADYNYAGKYFVVGSYVHEYSSRFGSSNPSGNFFQAGASWILTKESFMSNITPISFLKLRASYGTTGNAEIGNYQALGLYSIDQSANYGGVPGAYPTQKENPNLTWEKIKTANIGLDFGLFKRIDVSVDVYQKTSSALLFQVPLPATEGYDYEFENIGSVRNRGLEVNITSRNLVGAFKWETNLNLALNRNKVLSLESGETMASPGASQPVAVGHDINDWYMPIWAGVNPANGDPQWEQLVTDANGKVTKQLTNSYANATRQFTGNSSSPKLTGGITNTFSYKGFSLSTFFNFVYGNKVYNDSRAYFDNDGLYDSYNAMVAPSGWTRWTKPGDIATEPKAVQGGNNNSNQQSTRYLENGSYLRLRNATFGYQLPTSWINSLKIRSARIFVSGDNLVTFTKFSGVDPEVDLSPPPNGPGNRVAGGTSSFKYPISRKLLFGINVGF